MANLYTKPETKGQTSLVGGSRVSKSSLRVECYGTIDEANSMLGLAYAQTDREYIRTTVPPHPGPAVRPGGGTGQRRAGCDRADGKDLGGGRGLSGGRGGQVHRDHRETDSPSSFRAWTPPRRRSMWPVPLSAGRSAMWWPGGARAGTRGVGPLHQPPVRRAVYALAGFKRI